MKTILKKGNYERINDIDAEFKVNHQDWKYVSKSEWKENVRDINKKIELKPLPEKMVEAMNQADENVKKKKFKKGNKKEKN